MKQVMLAYYPAFRCIADRCRHNCCVGWEIDIARRYSAEIEYSDENVERLLAYF